EGLQDSTPIIETLEAQHPQPAIHPDDPVSAFVSALLEEFGDEWGNKWMFHYRWAREIDQIACSRRLATIMAPDASAKALEEAAISIRERMVNRVWFVGSSPGTTRQIEDSFKDTLALLEPHLADRPYLFGGRPAFADFGLWGQLYNAHRDPTPKGIIEIQAPNTLRWIERMLDPSAEGEFEPWADLAPSLTPLLTDQVGGLFLPWSAANARAVEEDAESFEVALRGDPWYQKPQKYHARSLAALQGRYQAVRDRQALDAALAETGCVQFLGPVAQLRQ
ncbi:MAG: glutathione S-transferase family protein, partial [Gammaproteobacteria bacterium]|nr:glutathione S-transferase family protein [Gammaproteobacteria bacterium]